MRTLRRGICDPTDGYYCSVLASHGETASTTSAACYQLLNENIIAVRVGSTEPHVSIRPQRVFVYGCSYSRILERL
jgi:hypothetical protein